MFGSHYGQFRHYSIPSCTYHKVYDKGIFTARPHRSFDPNSLEKFRGKRVTYPEAGIYSVDEGRVIAGKEAVYTKSGSQIQRLQSTRSTLFSHLKGNLPKDSIHINGTLLNLSLNGLEDNFYHFNCELLARFFIYLNSGIKADYFLVPTRKSFQREFLSLVGIEDEKVLSIEDGIRVSADNVLMPTFINNYSTFKAHGFEVYNKLWLPHWLRTAYKAVSQGLPVSEQPTRIYISRSQAQYRSVVNEACVIEHLSSKGFVCVCLENMSLADQIMLFKNAKFIIAPHGAGLVNMSWCNENAHIFEIYPSRYSDPSMRLQADLMGHRYCFTRSDYQDDQRINPHRMNLDINLSLVSQWLESCEMADQATT